MTLDEIQVVWAVLSKLVRTAEEAYLADIAAKNDAGGDNAPGGFVAAGLPWTANRLEQHFAVAAAALDREPWDTEVAAVTGMCCLGNRTPPPTTMVDAFADVVRIHVPPKNFGRLLDVTTAFGCGWARTIPRKAQVWDWNGRWNRSMTRLAGLIQRCAQQTIGRLELIGVRFPNGLPEANDAAGLILHAVTDPMAQLRGERLVIECVGDETEVHDSGTQLAALRFGARLVLQTAGGPATISVAGREPADYPAIASPGSVLHVLARIDETRVKCLPDDPAVNGWEIRLNADEALMLEPGGEAPNFALQRWACPCGNKDCEQNHRLDAWHLVYPNLDTFVRAVVSGVRSGQLETGRTQQFAVSVLGALWSREGL